jgi:hypothetical protein
MALQIKSDMEIPKISLVVTNYIKDAEGIELVFKIEQVRKVATEALSTPQRSYIEYILRMYT